MSSPSRLVASFAFVALLASACSSDPVDQPDAGEADGDADADADFEVALPVLTPCPDGWEEVPPEEEGGVTTCDPWPGSSPVVMTPCPEGWREVEDNGVVTCDPWPEDGPHECAEDEAHFPGEPGCSLIGTECPAGNWAEDLPEDGTILYVLAGVPAGGEGTQESPFGSITEALDVAVEGTVVALSKGTFDEAVRLRNGITLWGACVAETSLTCSTPHSQTGTVSVGGRNVVIRNLHIGGQRPGVSVVGGASYSVLVEDVSITHARIFGIWMVNGSLTATNVIVSDTMSQEGDFGHGLGAQEGAQVDVSRAVFVRNRDVGVVAFDAGTTVTLADSLVADTQNLENDPASGFGLSAQLQAYVVVQRSVFLRNRLCGIFAANVGTDLVLEDVVVHDTQAQEGGEQGGSGLFARTGAQVDVFRALFERNRDIGVFGINSGTTVALTDVVVRGTQDLGLEDRMASALTANSGAQIEVSRAVFDENEGLGMHAAAAGTRLRLSDIAIRDTKARGRDGLGGRGLEAHSGARVDVSGALFERNREIAVNVGNAGTTLIIEDAVVRDTLSQEASGLFGRGLEVGDGAHAEVDRVVFDRCRDLGVFAVHANTALTLTDAIVMYTSSRETDGRFGGGLNVQAGARVEVRRGLFRSNQETGLRASDEGSELSLTDVVVDGTREASCSQNDACSGFGDGVLSHNDAMMTMIRFSIPHSDRCGVTVHQASMDLHDGEISENTIGACINAEDFDLERLMDNVVYRDNERRLDPNFDMPVPEPALPLEWEEE